MNAIAKPNVQRLLVWVGGPLLAALLLPGLLLAGWLPPPGPDQTAAETARMYAEDKDGIRACGLLLMFAGGCQGMFTTIIAVYLRKIEGRGILMTYAQLGWGFIASVFFMIPAFFWMTASYRPERDPQITETLHDLGWLPFIGAIVPAVCQNLSIGIAILSDERTKPVFPRWLGYLNLWTILLYCPGAVIIFFKTGPFAWNGVFAFWVVVAGFTLWLTAMTVMLLRAINHTVAEAGADAPVTATQPTGVPAQ